MADNAPRPQGPLAPGQSKPGDPINPANSGLPLGSSIPANSPLGKRLQQVTNRAQASYIPGTTQGVFAGLQPAQLGPGVGFVGTYYNTDSVWRAYTSLQGADKARWDALVEKTFKGKTPTMNQLNALWSTGVQGSQSASAQNLAATPLDILEYQSASTSGPGGGGGGGGGGGPTSNTNTAVASRLTDPLSAERLLDTALSQYLGREANGAEKEAFLSALNAKEKASPTTTVTQTASSGGKASTSTSNSMTTGGTDPTEFATNWAQQQEGASEHYAATTLLDSFMNALNNENDVVR